MRTIQPIIVCLTVRNVSPFSTVTHTTQLSTHPPSSSPNRRRYGGSLLLSSQDNLDCSHDHDASSQNSKRKKGIEEDSFSKNEFSRTMSVSHWFSSVETISTTSNSIIGKSTNLHIQASESERSALASRFRLAHIASLSAELLLQPAWGRGQNGRHQNKRYDDFGMMIAASGSVSAQVKQTCVRTNDDFDVDLTFDFDTLLKAVVANRRSRSGTSRIPGEEEELSTNFECEDGYEKAQKYQQTIEKSKKRLKGGSPAFNSKKTKDWQEIVMENDLTSEEIIEDESCFCTDGIVDAGEIVAQIFRSKLDPYPKKPGTKPVKYTYVLE